MQALAIRSRTLWRFNAIVVIMDRPWWRALRHRKDHKEEGLVDITQLLAFSVKNKASDLHLSAGLPPMIRVHGDVRHRW